MGLETKLGGCLAMQYVSVGISNSSTKIFINIKYHFLITLVLYQNIKYHFAAFNDSNDAIGQLFRIAIVFVYDYDGIGDKVGVALPLPCNM